MSTQQEVKERGRRTAGDDTRQRLLSGLPVTDAQRQQIENLQSQINRPQAGGSPRSTFKPYALSTVLKDAFSL